jgi:NDP-sugar pyrophosphorylase family protein
MKVVIQCGGQGTRLRPYTTVLPKPLMPVNSKPVIELLLRWLRRNDFCDVFITTGYLAHLISSFCGDGHQWGLQISYTSEREPLGTIGPLTLLREKLDTTFLVINGDVLTDLSLGAFVAAHRKNGGLVTIAASARKTKLDFGVIEQTDNRVHGFKEKPLLVNMMSMGVYCMEPRVLDYIPEGVPFGFDNLIHTLLARGLPAFTFPHDGLWLDIGRIEDFQAAQELAWDDELPAFQVVAAA